MLAPSVLQLRLVCAVALACLILGQLPALGLISFGHEIATARLWKYYGAAVPSWLVWGFGTTVFVLWLIGLVGMLNFWRISRWCLAAAVALSVTLRPFLGLSVSSAYEASLASVFGLASSWLIAISFWTSLAQRFMLRCEGGTVP
jgi:hypothetical protein